MKVLLFFGGPSEERDVSAGSIKPWVTYLQADPSIELTVVFIDRALRAYRVPPVYYYANTCADFETQLRTLDLELQWDDVADLARAHDVAVPLIHSSATKCSRRPDSRCRRTARCRARRGPRTRSA